MNKKIKSIIFKKSVGGLVFGIAFSLGVFGTILLAVSVTGTINTFNKDDLVSSSKINENFTSLKTAITSIPNWTKSGADAYYTDGKVGIGTSTATQTLDVNGTIASSNLYLTSVNLAGSGSFTNTETTVTSVTGTFSGLPVLILSKVYIANNSKCVNNNIRLDSTSGTILETGGHCANANSPQIETMTIYKPSAGTHTIYLRTVNMSDSVSLTYAQYSLIVIELPFR